MSKKRHFAILTIAPALLAAACFGMVLVPQTASAQVSVSINVGPPPMRYEAVPAPRRGFVWVPGYWNWEGRRHVWVGGNWVRERPGYVYSQPSWVERGGHWELQRGVWTRGDRDRDHDGVHNGRDHDHDRDGDGVRNRRDDRPNNPRRD